MVKVVVPGSSANCCVGFDCLGMALSLYNTYEFSFNKELLIEGCDTKYQNEDNLVIVSFKHVLNKYHKEYSPIKLVIKANVPVSRGLGSSSTCVVAGVMGANALYDLNLSKEDIITLTSEIEGHPDNVCPAIYGGMTLAQNNNGELSYLKLEIDNYHFLALIPDYEVKTSEARKVLPSTMDYKDVVNQVAKAIGFVEGLQGDEELLFKNCEDKIHEPYRAKLIKEYSFIKEKTLSMHLPFWISGSGSTMIACSKDLIKLKELEAYAKMNCLYLELDRKGAYYG